MSQPPQPSASTAHSHLDALQPACEHLRAGGLVILPTDTVYGIGCNAADAGAVERLLASKGRGRQMPPPVLVAGVNIAEQTAQATHNKPEVGA